MIDWLDAGGSLERGQRTSPQLTASCRTPKGSTSATRSPALRKPVPIRGESRMISVLPAGTSKSLALPTIKIVSRGASTMSGNGDRA